MSRVKRPNISEVFTPRNPSVNPRMYIPRPRHERELARSISGSLHAILFGESGSGKSWLYKKVAGDQDWKVVTANCATADRMSSLSAAIAQAVFPRGHKELEQFEQSIEAGASIGIGKGGSAAKRTYSVAATEILERAFEEARRQAGRNKKPVIVLENLEAIFEDEALLRELGNIVLLLDDERYAQYGVKLLIVGVPANLIEYFQRIRNLEPVANRLRENPPVQALSEDQVRDLVARGFNELLELGIGKRDIDKISAHVYHATLGIASPVQEYCEYLAYEIEDHDWQYSDALLQRADWEFVRNSILQAYAVVDRCMNEKETTSGRRNQVLYAMSKIEDPSFDATRVESIVRREFPDSTKGVQLGIPQILAELTGEDRKILRRVGRGANYRYEDPKYLMCSRLVLVKTQDGRVQKKTIKR